METEQGGPFEKMVQNPLMIDTFEILDEEKLNILTETLRCDVCLELPLEKQVKICEQGHHFCVTCHSSIRACGVCRGRLLESRNFVVEQLVTKLAPILDISKYKLPPAEPPCPLSKGSFRCLHECLVKVCASLMLPHLRDFHRSHLTENVRSNPFSGQFSFTYNIKFIPNEKFVWSVQVSDMGLFTVQLIFFELDFFGCIRTLMDQNAASQFKYLLALKIPTSGSEPSVEYCVSNCSLLDYSADIESVKQGKNCLKIKGQNLLEYIETGTEITVFFSVGKSTGSVKTSKQPTPPLVCLPEKNLFFMSDRKIRRNKNRNMRRKKLKEKIRNAEITL